MKNVNVAMRCNREQYESIRSRLLTMKYVEIGINDFELNNYLVNNYNRIDGLGNLSTVEKKYEVYEHFDGELFLSLLA